MSRTAEMGLSSKERLNAVFRGQAPDRTPTLGGWIAWPGHICTLAGVTLSDYKENPVDVSIKAYRSLGVDGLIDVFVPSTEDGFRNLDEDTFVHAETRPLESVVEEIEAMPAPEEIESAFDFEGEYAEFSTELKRMGDQCGDLLYMPAQWAAGAHAGWYWEFGYENFFLLVGEYPGHAQRLMEIGGARGRCRSKVVARAVEEGLYPPAVLLGEDICTQRGPMISPAFLEKYYAPSLQYGLEPLLEAGVKPVWHSDGDVRLIVDLLIDCGIQGFQGFQPECGVTIDFMAEKRTRDGQPLLIFGPIAVTTELPVCSPDEIRQKARRAIEVCHGRADLVLFTSNTINPDVPIENVCAMYQAVQESDSF